MTAEAEPLDSLAEAGGKRRTLSLAQKYTVAFLGLVTAVLLINGAIDMTITYRDARVQAVRVQQEKAKATAERVVDFISKIEQQLGWTTRAEWAFVSVDQRRYDFIRLLRQVPAITELIHVDGSGREQLKLSRLEPDSVGSNIDLSADPRFLASIRDGIFYGPVIFRRGSEPYMTIGMRHAGRKPGATIADVNLKLVWDVVTAIRVGKTGYAFITDPTGRLLAHPDMNLVLRNTDLSNLPQVAAALDASSGAKPAVTGIGSDGREVLSAYSNVPKVGWSVFVELPAAEAMEPVWSAIYQTLACRSSVTGNHDRAPEPPHRTLTFGINRRRDIEEAIKVYLGFIHLLRQNPLLILRGQTQESDLLAKPSRLFCYRPMSVGIHRCGQ